MQHLGTISLSRNNVCFNVYDVIGCHAVFFLDRMLYTNLLVADWLHQ